VPRCEQRGIIHVFFPAAELVSLVAVEKTRTWPYWIELATDENTLLEWEARSRIVLTTTARTTPSIIAYSAMSCPPSSHNLFKTRTILDPRYKRKR